MSHRKVGRPKIPKRNRKSTILTFRVSGLQLRIIDKMWKKSGMRKRGDWIRDFLTAMAEV